MYPVRRAFSAFFLSVSLNYLSVIPGAWAIPEPAATLGTITYDKDSKMLKAEEMRELDRLVAKAKSEGEIAEIKVLAWADREYPRENENIPARDKHLAEARAASVKDYLRSKHKIAHVSTYNMAERPNLFEKIFGTEDFKIKKDADAGKQDAGSSKTNGRASSVLIIVDLK